MLLPALSTACDSASDSAGGGPDPSTLDGDLDGVTPKDGDCDDADSAAGIGPTYEGNLILVL